MARPVPCTEAEEIAVRNPALFLHCSHDAYHCKRFSFAIISLRTSRYTLQGHSESPEFTFTFVLSHKLFCLKPTRLRRAFRSVHPPFPPPIHPCPRAATTLYGAGSFVRESTRSHARKAARALPSDCFVHCTAQSLIAPSGRCPPAAISRSNCSNDICNPTQVAWHCGTTATCQF
jgi:hypothetical protein